MEIDKKRILSAVIFLVILGAIIWVVIYFGRQGQEQALAPDAAKAAREAIEGITETPQVKVPTSANPVKRVLPEENPIETANPFNKVYKNPFE